MDGHPRVCAMCGKLSELGRLTCSDACHEEFVKWAIAKYGEFKKIVRGTGIAYKVPLRVIIEKGIKEQDLGQYPLWDEKEGRGSCPRCGTRLLFEELTLRMWCPGCSDYVENIRQKMNLDDGIQLEHRQGQSGLRVTNHFFPFLKKGERPDAIISVPWNQAEVERYMREYPNLVVTKGKCDQCNCEISLAGSTRALLAEFPDVPTRCINCVTKEIQKKEEQHGK